MEVKGGRGRVDNRSRAFLKPAPTSSQNWPWTSMGSFPGPSLKLVSRKPSLFLISPTHPGSPFLKVLGAPPISYLAMAKMPRIVFKSISIFPTQLNQKGPWKKKKKVFLTFPPRYNDDIPDRLGQIRLQVVCPAAP